MVLYHDKSRRSANRGRQAKRGQLVTGILSGRTYIGDSNVEIKNMEKFFKKENK